MPLNQTDTPAETVAGRRNAALPAYHRLYVMILELINDGEFPAGTLLPSEKTLTETYKVSRVTVRRAIAQLVEDGVVQKHQGQGTIVSIQDEDDHPEPVSGLIANLISQGVEFTCRTLIWEMRVPNSSVRQRLKLQRDEQCYLIRRIRFLGDSPISYASIYVPQHIGALIKPKKNTNTLVLQMLDDVKHPIHHMNFSMTATLAHGESAKLLELPEGSPTLRMRGLAFNAEEEVIYYQESLYHPERYEYSGDLVRDSSSGKFVWQPKF